MLYDVFYDAYNYWNTIDLAGLVKQTDPTGKSNIWLTPAQFKSITGQDLSTVIASEDATKNSSTATTATTTTSNNN